MGAIEARLQALGIELPTKLHKGKGLIPAVQHGDLLFVSATGRRRTTGRSFTAAGSARGESGAGLPGRPCDGHPAPFGASAITSATWTGWSASSKCSASCNSAPDFHDQPGLMHGFSDLMVDVFVQRASTHGARSAPPISRTISLSR